MDEVFLKIPRNCARKTSEGLNDLSQYIETSIGMRKGTSPRKSAEKHNLYNVSPLRYKRKLKAYED